MASGDNKVPSSPPPPPPTGADDDGAGGGKAEENAAPADREQDRGALSLQPGLPIRGIRMKFAVLTGLVEVGEVSNRDLVETLFNLVSAVRCGGLRAFFAPRPWRLQACVHACAVQLIDLTFSPGIDTENAADLKETGSWSFSVSCIFFFLFWLFSVKGIM